MPSRSQLSPPGTGLFICISTSPRIVVTDLVSSELRILSELIQFVSSSIFLFSYKMMMLGSHPSTSNLLPSYNTVSRSTT